MIKKNLFLMLGLAALLTACSSAPTQQSSVESTSAEPVQESAAASSAESGSESKNSHYPVTVTNYNYAGDPITLTFEKAPERVLAVYQGSIETMIALGLEDHVAASYGLDNEVKDEWKDGFSRMNYSDSGFAPDKETVVMLKPDLILSWSSLFGEKMLGDVDYWIENGTNTYMNTNTRAHGDRTLENEFTDIINIGKIFDVEDKAEALVGRMKADIEKTKEKVEAEAEAPSIGIIEFYDEGKIRNYGQELAGNIAEHLGVNIMKSSEMWIGKENLVEANPDVILVVYMPVPDKGGESIKDEQLAKVLDDGSFASLSAVKNKKVYGIMLGDIYAPAVRTGDGIRTIANSLYPGLIN